MIAKGLAIWLLVLVSYGSTVPLVSFSQPSATPYPIWKVHRYTGIQLQPVESSQIEYPTENENPSIVNVPDYPVSEPDEPEEEDPYPSGGLGTILSLIPGGLSGLISLSAGSGRNEEDTGDEEGRIAEDRLGLVGLKKDILSSIFQKKIELLTALKRDAIQLAIRKVQAKKAWIKNLLFGSAYPGNYYNLPYYYPKKSSIFSYLPLVGHWFGGGTQLPEVQLPYVPNLIALKDPPHLPIIDLHGKYQFPYQSGTYVKVDYPDKYKPVLKPDLEYQVPSTSYGIPDSPISVPQLPFYEKNPPTFSHEPVISTSAPEIVIPEVYPYPSESPAVPHYPQPGHLEPVVPYPVSHPYPPESYPYASSDYYDTAQSEIQPVKEGPFYRHLKYPKKEPGTENIFQDRLDEESNGDNTEKNKETIVRR